MVGSSTVDGELGKPGEQKRDRLLLGADAVYPGFLVIALGELGHDGRELNWVSRC